MSIRKRLFLYINMIVFAALLAGCSNMLDVPGEWVAELKIATPGGGYSVAEFNGTLELTATLGRKPSGDVTVSLTSSDLTEGTVTPSSLTFTPSNWDDPQTITVTGVDEFVADTNQNISLWFGAATSTDTAYNGYVCPSIGITVIDNETPSIVVSHAAIMTTTEAAGAGHTATFTVVLSSEPTGNVTIPTVVSNDTTEGTVSLSSITFTPSNWNVQQVVTITGVDENIYDRNIEYYVQLGTSNSTDPDYNNKSFAPITVTNNDDELPAVIVTPTILNLTEGNTGTFTVKLGNVPTGTVTIPLSISNTVRGSVNTSLLTFNAGNYNTPQLVTVTAIQNSKHDGNVTATVVLGVATGYNNEKPDDVTVNITDDDSFSIKFIGADNHTNEAGQIATFSVKIGSQPSNDVIVNLNEAIDANNAGNEEGTIDEHVLTFTSANWNVPQTVTVTGVNDDYDDGNKGYLIYATTVTLDPDYQGITNNFALINDDNDHAALEVEVSGIPYEITSSARTFSGFATDDMNRLGSNYAKWKMRLTSKPAVNVNITLTCDTRNTTNDGVFTGTGTGIKTLTFTAENWMDYQEVLVYGSNEAVPTNEGGHDYTITTAISASGDANYGVKTKVNWPSFSIFSCDNDAANKIAYCRKSGGFSTSENLGTATLWLLSQSIPLAAETVPVSVTDKYSDKPAYASSGIAPALCIAQIISSSNATVNSGNYNQLESGTNKVVVRGIDDGILPLGSNSYTVLIGSSGTTLNYDAPDVILSNYDNDQVVEVGNPVGETSEDGTTGTFSVKLKIQPTAGTYVSFTVSSATPTEGTFTPQTLTFDDAHPWNVWQTITVTGVEDHRVDGKLLISVSYGELESSDLRLNGCDGGTASTGLYNTDNDKLIWITEPVYYGNMGSGTSHADTALTTDLNYPNEMKIGGALYGSSNKALIVDGATRIARTTPTGNTGQLNWVLKANTEYYLYNGTIPCATKVFTTDANKIPGALQVNFFLSTDSFWTGLNADWTTSIYTCYSTDYMTHWMSDSTYGQYGVGGTNGTGSFSSGRALGNDSTKRSIIAVQQ